MNPIRKIIISFILIFIFLVTLTYVFVVYAEENEIKIQKNDYEILNDLEKETWNLINEERLKQGISPLNIDKGLVELARKKAR